MAAMAQVADVEALLPAGTIPEDQHPYVSALISEAGDLVEAYCRRTFPAPVPDSVRRVVSRMAARVWQQDSSEPLPINATSMSLTAGPFSRSVGLESGSTSGGVWLSASDKQRLARWRRGVFTVDLV